MPRITTRSFFFCILCAAVAVHTSGDLAQAVVTISTQTGNTSPPPDNPGFYNVGQFAAGSTVYLGNGWALTATHLDTLSGGSATTVTFGNGVGTYNILQKINVLNPTGLGLTTNSDLMLLKLDGSPALPTINIASTPAPVGGAVTMIGRGIERQAGETYWNVTGTSPDYTWTESAPPGNASGFKASGGAGVLRWGTNLISDEDPYDGVTSDPDHSLALQVLAFQQIVFLADFNSLAGGGTTHEAMFSSGDSGGGTFYKNGANWELTGINHATLGFEDQPASTYVYGNLSAFSDLSQYRTTIMAIVPEPSTFALAGLAGAGLLACAIRRLRNQRVTVHNL